MKDLKINLTIGDNGNVIHETSKLTGELMGIFVDSQGAVKIDCQLSEYPNISLLNVHNVQGQKFYPLMYRPMNGEGEGYNYVAVPFPLNNALYFHLMGKMGTEVEIIVRYK